MQKYFDFRALKNEPWAQSDEVKERLAEAQQSQKNFKPLQLPPPITKEKFTTIWLALLCQEPEMTKRMLKKFGLSIFIGAKNLSRHPVTKLQAKAHLNTTPRCKPYRKLLD